MTKKYYMAKKNALENVLGPMDKVMGHGLIGFHFGGPIPLYYFSRYILGTVFATMELIDPKGKNPISNTLGTYELIACTRIKNPISKVGDISDKCSKKIETAEFDKVESRSRHILTIVGKNSFDIQINPGETAQIPQEEGGEDMYVLFDEFDTKGIPFVIDDKRYGLLLCIEVFKQELEYAQENGSEKLINILKSADVYPYSDLSRESVVY